MVRLALVAFGALFFVIFTSSLNAAQTDGAPIGVGGSIDTVLIIIFGFVFVRLGVGGMRLAGLSRRAAGMIALAVGAVIAVTGVWHHVDGPALDKIGPVRDDRIPIPAELNILVYVVAGLCLTAGLTMLGTTIGEHRQAARRE